MTRGRVVLREEDPHYRTLVTGLLSAVGLMVADDADVLVAPGSPEDSGRFKTFVCVERPFAPGKLLDALEAAF